MSDSTDDQAEELQPLPSDNLEQYMLRGRRQIRQVLEQLIDGHALVTTHLQPGSQAFLTALITLSDDEEWLFLDASPDARIRQRTLQSEQLLCVTQLNKIRIQFKLHDMTETLIDKRPALAARVPDEILRLQRREYFRLSVPLAHNLTCRLPDSGWGVGEEARVMDISAGGLCLNLPGGSTELVIGSIVPSCRLKLPDTEVFTLDLEIRNISRQRSRSGVESLRVGCRYSALSKVAETQIQRYIFHTERELSARERGGL